ncbi:MAG: hypothetical protein RLZZ70_201 [Candidatus Parcubacteria bacterium]
MKKNNVYRVTERSGDISDYVVVSKQVFFGGNFAFRFLVSKSNVSLLDLKVYKNRIKSRQRINVYDFHHAIKENRISLVSQFDAVMPDVIIFHNTKKNQLFVGDDMKFDNKFYLYDLENLTKLKKCLSTLNSDESRYKRFTFKCNVL